MVDPTNHIIAYSSMILDVCAYWHNQFLFLLLISLYSFNIKSPFHKHRFINSPAPLPLRLYPDISSSPFHVSTFTSYYVSSTMNSDASWVPWINSLQVIYDKCN